MSSYPLFLPWLPHINQGPPQIPTHMHTRPESSGNESWWRPCPCWELSRELALAILA